MTLRTGPSLGTGTLRGGFIPGTPDTWNPHVAFLVFPRITSSPRIERRAMSRFAARSHHIATLPVADQVRELQTALSVNKSELARILRVSRPTVYDWLDGGQPNADNRARIRTLMRLLRESGVTAANPLFPRRGGCAEGGWEGEGVGGCDGCRAGGARGLAAGGWVRGGGRGAAEGQSCYERGAHGVAAGLAMGREFDRDRVAELG